MIFALWFASGAVLLFEPFPSLSKVDGQALGRSIDTSAVKLTPAQALAAAGGGTGVRLRQRATVPAYIVAGGANPAVIDARSGRRMPLLSPQAAASVFGAGQSAAVAGVVGPFGYDQWVVHDRFDALRPFYRVDLADPAGTQLYVSARTGEVVQRTTRSQRGWNWVGAVLHWAYVTPLRSSFRAWDRTVWIVSFVAMLVAAAGMILGIVRMAAVRRARRPGLTFYRRPWMRWHHLIGLFAGLFVLTWTLSGWLSMDHGRLFSRGRATEAQAAAYAGSSISAAAADMPVALLRRFSGTKEIAVTSIAGVPLLAVTDSHGRSALFDRTGGRVPLSQSDTLIGRGLGRAWRTAPARAGRSVPIDDFYSLAEGLPPTARRFAGEGIRPPVYVDGGTGNILVVMNTSRAAYAWIYYALHSFNFPGLAHHQILRDILVLVPLTAGFLFSITGVVLGWQRLLTSTVPAKPKEIGR